MRLHMLLFAVFALSSSASIASDADIAAKKIFGDIATNVRSGNNEELFNVLHAKWEHFYPGLIAPDIMNDFRKAFLTVRANQNKNHTSFSLGTFLSVAKSVGRVEKEIKRRIWWLNAEGQAFLNKTFASFPTEFSGATKLSLLSEKFDAFRAEFDSLANSSKKKLTKRFEIFAHLDEVKALVSAYDGLLSAAQTACENLEGFKECEHIAKREDWKKGLVNEELVEF